MGSAPDEINNIIVRTQGFLQENVDNAIAEKDKILNGNNEGLINQYLNVLADENSS